MGILLTTLGLKPDVQNKLSEDIFTAESVILALKDAYENIPDNNSNKEKLARVIAESTRLTLMQIKEEIGDWITSPVAQQAAQRQPQAQQVPQPTPMPASQPTPAPAPTPAPTPQAQPSAAKPPKAKKPKAQPPAPSPTPAPAPEPDGDFFDEEDYSTWTTEQLEQTLQEVEEAKEYFEKSDIEYQELEYKSLAISQTLNDRQ